MRSRPPCDDGRRSRGASGTASSRPAQRRSRRARMRRASASRASQAAQRSGHRNRAGHVRRARPQPTLLATTLHEGLNGVAAAPPAHRRPWARRTCAPRSPRGRQPPRRDVEPGHRLHRIGVHERARRQLTDQVDDVAERLDRADLVVHQHEGHDDRVGIERVRSASTSTIPSMSAPIRTTRKPSASSRSHDASTPLCSNRAVTTPSPWPRARAACRTLQREVVGLGPSGGEHDLGRRGPEQPGHVLPGLLEGVLGCARRPVTA